MLELINVNPSNGDPIYKQLNEQIVRLIVGRQIDVGEELPSVRKIAEYFSVNPMTVSRAIGILVDQGWLERRRGQPTRVAKNTPVQADQNEQLLCSAIDELIKQANQLGIEYSELTHLINKRWKI